MVQRAYRIVELIIVKKRQFVVNLGSAWSVIECRFIKVYRSSEIPFGLFIVCVLHQLDVPGIAYPIATS